MSSTAAPERSASTPARRAGRTARAATVLVPAAVFAVVWWFFTAVLAGDHLILSGFAPQRALPALAEIAVHGTLVEDVAASLWRLLVGMGIAVLVGIPLGLTAGLLPIFERATRPLFHFLRMISPLSWAPVAVALFGIGHQPVFFLIAIAAVWPITLNTIAGVHAIEPGFLHVARSLGAGPVETLTSVVLPAVRAHLLTGVRLALGTAWLVLVPAEMLGVDSGLGYAILNARDRLAFDQLMAVILVIGALGYLLDSLARRALRSRPASGRRGPGRIGARP